MNPLSRLVLPALLLSSSLLAQENHRDVIPGRDFRDHKLLTPGAVDVWNLEVEAGERLWCQVDSTEFDPVLELVDAKGVVIAANDGAGTHSELWLAAPASGAVAFRVSAFRGSGGGNYTYWLHRFRTAPLGSDAHAEHRFGREQWWHWRVTLQEGDVLVPTVSGNGRLTLVFDASRAHVAEELGGYRAPHAGEYFVRVEGSENEGCRVRTQLARRRELALDTTHEDLVAPFGLDHWRVAMRGGDAFVLDLRVPNAPLAHELVDARPVPQEGPAFVATGSLDKGGQVRRWFVARRDAVLELRVRNGGSGSTPYHVAVSRPERPGREGEPQSHVLPLGDGVVHRLELTAGELVRIAMKSRAFDARFDVWDPAGNVIARADDEAPLVRDASHTLLVPASGTFRVIAYTNGGAAAGDYTLAVDTVAVPQARLTEPVPLQLVEGGTSYVHLPLRAGEEVWLSVRSTCFDAGLTVLEPSGRAVLSAEGGGTGDDVLVAFRASVSGRHTLLVHSRRGAGEGTVKVAVP